MDLLLVHEIVSDDCVNVVYCVLRLSSTLITACNRISPNQYISSCDDLQVQPSSGSYKTVNVITQEDFEKMAPRAPRKVNPEVPPPPPPSLSTAPEFPTTQQLDEDTLLENVSQVKQSLF